MTPEFSRPIKLDQIGSRPQSIDLTATPGECAALAARFDLASLASLSAKVAIAREGDSVSVSGQFAAKLEQACIASGDPVAAAIGEPLTIRFIPPAAGPDELELDSADCDILDHDGLSVDLGEAIAQSLGLALNPYPRSAKAEALLKAAGVKSEEEASALGPLAALLTPKVQQ